MAPSLIMHEDSCPKFKYVSFLQCSINFISPGQSCLLIHYGRQQRLWLLLFWSIKCSEAPQSKYVRTWTTKETVSLLLVSSYIIWSVFRLIQDPLVHCGCHFGCAVHTFCSVQTLVTNGIIHMGEDDMESLAAAYVLQLPSTQPVMQTFLVLGSGRSLQYSANSWRWSPGWRHASWSLQKMMS